MRKPKSLDYYKYTIAMITVAAICFTIFLIFTIYGIINTITKSELEWMVVLFGGCSIITLLILINYINEMYDEIIFSKFYYTYTVYDSFQKAVVNQYNIVRDSDPKIEAKFVYMPKFDTDYLMIRINGCIERAIPLNDIITKYT